MRTRPAVGESRPATDRLGTAWRLGAGLGLVGGVHSQLHLIRWLPRPAWCCCLHWRASCVFSAVTGQSRGARLSMMDTRLHAHNALYILARPPRRLCWTRRQRHRHARRRPGLAVGGRPRERRHGPERQGRVRQARALLPCFCRRGVRAAPGVPPEPSDTLPPRAARPSFRPRSLCARRRPRCWTSARRCGAREWPCRLCTALLPVLGLPCVLCRHPAAAAKQTCPGPAAGTPSTRSRTWATPRGCAVPALLVCKMPCKRRDVGLLHACRAC